MKAFERKKEVDKIDSQEYLAQMVKQYQNLVFSICVKMTRDYFIAEDLTQETFLSAFRHLDSFDGQNEKSWLCRIATNKCIDYQKQAARRVVPTEDCALETEQSKEGLPESSYMEQEAIEQLKERCKNLKPPYDEVARMYFVEEHTADEIAQIRQKNVKTIQTQIYRARGMLRRLYGKERGSHDGS